VEGAEWDWVISRQRIFGTPLPFYLCECGGTAAVDPKELPFYPEKAKGKKCDCGKKMKPETSTCDCWVDSSISPLVIAGWPDEKKMERFYPVSLRPQGVEIVRTWAFYTIYRSGVALTKMPPFETILLNGNVLAPDGKKMSKSLGNIISPAELQRDYPVDAIRQWAAMSGAMAKDRPFSYEDIKYSKSFLTKVWNAARFVETMGRSDKAEDITTIDKWILGRLSSTIKESTEALENYEYHAAIGKIQSFFWSEFCDYYLEYVKHRVYNGEPTKDAALFTLNKVLQDTIKILAPITPHISEELFRMYGKTSVHHEKWPEAGDEYKDEVEKVAPLNELISQLRQYKSNNKLAQNAELESVLVTTPRKLDKELIEELSKISKIKNIENTEGELSISVQKGSTETS
jgi:valyl-tRNA synthetase